MLAPYMRTFTLVTKVYFTSPSAPDINTFFADIGDNLGGSDVTHGPLKNISSTLSTKLLPLAHQTH